MSTAVLRLHCKDTKGIVYNVSRFIFERGGNIISSQQHLEELDQQFFMRVHFDRAAMTIPRAQLEAELAGLAAGLGMQAELSFEEDRKRMAILVSKYDHCLYDLFLRHQYGEINADIALVVSNHEDLAHVAEQFKTPFFHVPVEKGQKQAAEERLLALLREHRVDFVVLARYMQVVTPLIIDAFEHRIINVHHGFLPAFKGARPYHQAYERGVKLIGATSHYVNEELDNGPIIAQETIPVTHGHSVKQMLAQGRDAEKRVLANAVSAHAADLIMVYRNRTIVFAG